MNITAAVQQIVAVWECESSAQMHAVLRWQANCAPQPISRRAASHQLLRTRRRAGIQTRR